MSTFYQNGMSNIQNTTHDSSNHHQRRQGELRKWSSGNIQAQPISNLQTQNKQSNITNIQQDGSSGQIGKKSSAAIEKIDKLFQNYGGANNSAVGFQSGASKIIENTYIKISDHKVGESPIQQTGNLNSTQQQIKIQQSINQNMNSQIQCEALQNLGKSNGPISQNQTSCKKMKQQAQPATDLFAWLEMSPPKDQNVQNPENVQSSDFNAINLKIQKNKKSDAITGKNQDSDNKTDHTSANSSQSSLKSSPDAKIESDKIKSAVAAKKLLFEENEAAEKLPILKKVMVPSYRILAGRKQKTVFKPKGHNVRQAQKFMDNIDLNAEITVSPTQAAKWSEQLNHMMEAVHQELKPADNIMNKDFFSFQGFEDLGKVGQEGNRTSYKKMAATGQDKYNISSHFDFNMEIPMTAKTVKATTSTVCKSDEDTKTTKTAASSLDFLNQMINGKKEAAPSASAQPKSTTSTSRPIKSKVVASRQEKFFDHSNYNKVPDASQVPMSFFD